MYRGREKERERNDLLSFVSYCIRHHADQLSGQTYLTQETVRHNSKGLLSFSRSVRADYIDCGDK